MSAQAQSRPSLRWWGGRFRSLVFDVVVAAVPVVAHLYSHGGRLPEVAPLPIAVLVAGFIALLVRRRFPFAVAVVTAVLGALDPQVLGVAQIALFTVGSRCGSRWTTWTAGGLHIASVLWRIALFSGFEWNNALVAAMTTALQVPLPILLGLWVLQRQTALANYRARAEQIERERELLAERAVGVERRRIAREMHDVVAHRVGIVSLHAGALAVNPPDDTAGELAETIRTTSNTAMTELRDMLRVLRDDDADTDLASTTTLAGIAELVDDAARSGSDVRLAMPDPVPELAGGAQRAAFRVAQEGITNAGKHAPGSAVRVEVADVAGEVVVTVTNGPARRVDAAELPSSGFGLVGMRERVALAGGRVASGPTDDGGYRVRATFPRDPEDEIPGGR